MCALTSIRVQRRPPHVPAHGKPVKSPRQNQLSRFRVTRWTALSDARVPCVSIFCPQHAGAQAFAELFEVISDREAGDVFDVLVAELAGNAHPQRSAEWHRQLAAVHTVADESLRVQRLTHVYAIPYLGLDRAVHNVSGL